MVVSRPSAGHLELWYGMHIREDGGAMVLDVFDSSDLCRIVLDSSQLSFKGEQMAEAL